MTNTVGTVDMTIIGLYFLLLLGVGLYAGCKIKTMEDYAVAGRRLGYPILLGTLIGTAIGAGSTIGQTGKAYTYGVAFFFVAISYGVGLIAFSFLAPVLRRTKIWTIPDALVLRYGSSMRWISAVVIFFAVIALYGAHLIAMGTTVSILLGDWGITFGQAVVVAGLIMVIYTILGGLLAVAYTDFLQAIIMLVGIGLVLPWCIAGEMGGLSGVWAHIKPEAGNFWKGLSPAYLIGVWVTYISINLIEPSLWQRASAAKNDRMLKRSLLITGGVYFYWSVVGAMLGATAAYLYPELGASAGGADASVPMHIARFLPPALKGLCLAALMAAIMSTADTFLLIAGTTFSHNLVGGIRPHTSGKTLVALSRAGVLVIGVLGIVLALKMAGVFNVMMLAMGIAISGLLMPVLTAMFWKKATRAGALASTVTAAVTVIALSFLKMAGKLPAFVEPVLAALLISFLLMIGVSLITYRPEAATPRLCDLEPVD